MLAPACLIACVGPPGWPSVPTMAIPDTLAVLFPHEAETRGIIVRVAVSPRSGRAVSAAEAEPYAGRLLPLPPFVLEGGPANWAETLDGLALSGHFLARDVLTDRAEPLLDARARLLDRLRRAAGLA